MAPDMIGVGQKNRGSWQKVRARDLVLFIATVETYLELDSDKAIVTIKIS